MFPRGNPTAALLASLATFGVGYVARPIGSFFMGYIGDRVGRKALMMLTLLMMGIGTFLIGCLPTYDQIGMAAPVLLVPEFHTVSAHRGFWRGSLRRRR